MKSKSNLLVLAFLLSSPVFAQTLPDEINYGPYQVRYQSLERETNAAAVVLAASRSSLADAQKFIREMTEHIRVLHSNIAEAESEIADLRRSIPELERQISNLRSEDSRVNQEIRGRQSDESQYVSRYQEAQRDLRPLEQLLARKEQRLRELQSELAQYERVERDAGNRLARAQTEASRLESQIANLRKEIREMQEELRNIDNRIAGAQSQISSLESTRGTLDANLNTERSKLQALSNRVTAAEAELAQLRASNAPADQIQAAERKVNAVRNARDNTAREIRQIESQIANTNSQITRLRSHIDDLRRTQTQLPSRISSAENRVRSLESERGQAINEVNRYSVELQAARRNVALREEQVAREQAEIRVDQQNVMRQRQLMENIARQIEAVRSEIASLQQRSRNLNAEISRASQTIRSHQARIPELESGIRNDQNEIAEGERDLIQARNDERTFTAKVAKDEATLNDLTNRRNTAGAEFNQRRSLYNRYLSEAEELGASQAGSGTTLGQKEGERLSSVLSKQNGSATGKEVGALEARHWGSVRGEVQGYHAGHAEGLASQEDISRATAEASLKAALDAELFAQRNFKPAFFEEFVQAEFKKPLPVAKILNFVSRVQLAELVELDVRQTVLPPSSSELSESESLKTPLDASIIQVVKDLKQAEDRKERLGRAEVAFEAPVKIPFGTSDCTKVYKGLAVFKASCEGSYKGAFTNNFVEAARDTFSASYTGQFQSVFEEVNVAEREAHYKKELAAASVIGKAEGLRVGKIEIFQSTYENVYKIAYASELEKARAKAKVDAGAELASFLKVKPLLTVESTTLAAENFRGGEEVVLKGRVKNVSAVALSGPVVVRITSLQNAEKITGEAVLNAAGGMSLTALPELKVKVLPTTKAGEKIVVKGTVEMPGDLYKPARVETFELIQVLSANPANDLGMDYNKIPDIKGPFRRYIHFASVKISPTVEDIKDGYHVTLTPVAESSGLVDMQTAELSTGALAVGTQKELRFSYVFKDQAKGKQVTLELAVKYAGKVIRKELITVTPK